MLCCLTWASCWLPPPFRPHFKSVTSKVYTSMSALHLHCHHYLGLIFVIFHLDFATSVLKRPCPTLNTVISQPLPSKQMHYFCVPICLLTAPQPLSVPCQELWSFFLLHPPTSIQSTHPVGNPQNLYWFYFSAFSLSLALAPCLCSFYCAWVVHPGLHNFWSPLSLGHPHIRVEWPNWAYHLD